MAGNTPQIGPVPTWVSPPPDLPVEASDLKGLPLILLLNDTQLSFDAEGWTEYREIEVKVQASSGLQALGNIPYQWSPWADVITFHHARILREGQTIDVLPKDGAFTVLRRETGLEQAMLTGVLTALLQPEGLQVGDILDVAVSIRHADPLLKGRTGALYAGWDLSPVGRVRLQARWPAALAVRSRETPGLPPLRMATANGEATAELDLDNVRPMVLPAHAPPRFLHGREVEFTTFKDWREVAQAMAPLYAKAAQLGPQSPVAAQAALIAKASTDPKARAAAALRLVEGEVRYLAHAEAAGGHTPQDADETWRLRYGDCKAKTVLLIALLRALGVPAEAALASTVYGDGLNDHLPSAGLFDHVVVRVTLGGRDYWLDGTRQGDRGLDDLTTPALGWVLPLDSPEGRLIRVTASQVSKPQIVQVIRYDASGGVTAPEPTHLETTFRGDAGFALKTTLAEVAPERLDAALKAYWAGVHTAFTPTHLAAAWNPETGEETLTADGASKLDWSGAGLELQHVEMGGAPDIKRDPAATSPGAPYVLEFPSYIETDESVVLAPAVVVPEASLEAARVDTVVGGVAYHRTAAVEGGVVRVVATQRSLQPEITAAEAQASVGPLTKLGDQGVYISAGQSARSADNAKALDSHPTTADGHFRRGNALIDAGRFAEAVTELDAAIAQDPTSQAAWATRAIAYAWRADPQALRDADHADSLGKPTLVAARARGLYAQVTGDMAGARAAFRAALTLSPGDDFSLSRLIPIEIDGSDFDSANRDLASLMKSRPDLAPTTHLWRALISHGAHDDDAAKRELAEAPAATADQRLSRGRVYLQIGDQDLARADADAALRIKPSVAAWLLRASADGGAGDPAASADIDAALKLAPEDQGAQRQKALALAAQGDWAGELKVLDQILRDHPDSRLNTLLWRAQIEGRLGDRVKMEADFAEARAATGPNAPEPAYICSSEVAAKADAETALADCNAALRNSPTSEPIRLARVLLLHRLGRTAEFDAALADLTGHLDKAVELNNVCYDLAVENISLTQALAACDASLTLKPGVAATLDSRAFVLMRMGRNEEALAAYDAALQADPRELNSLYGRALVEARLGQSKAAEADRAAAVARRPSIEADYKRIGLSS
jgi:tetratricopeptide (TPR) repeat protein